MLIVLLWLVTLFTAAALVAHFIETRGGGQHTKTVSLLFASGVVSPVFVVLLVAYRGVM